jgi:hypothetical protein
MQGFNTARVLVLDDQLEQAMPVIRALGSLGMAAIYHNGGVDVPLERKLTGVRVMFIDMVLAEHGADANDPTSCIALVTQTLNRLVEDSYDPITVVCWTGHEDMAGAFFTALKLAFPKAKIDNVIVAQKPDASEEDECVEKLRQLITEAIQAQRPVNALFRWEQMVHDAATQTTSEITRLMRGAECKEKAWGQCGYQICAALALAERGSRLLDEDDFRSLKALFDALNPLLSDRLDYSPVPDEPELGSLAKTLKETAKAELAQWPKKSLLTSELRAALNTMVHLSPNATQGELCPGDVYFADEKNCKIAGDAFPDWKDVRGEICSSEENSSASPLIPLVIEVSAACDFAQAKTRLPRFIAGFFVPESKKKIIRRSNYAKMVGPLFIKTDGEFKLDGVYYLVCNAHYLLSIERTRAIELAPSRRLRTPILSDFLAWIGSHMSRPGPLHIGP